MYKLTLIFLFLSFNFVSYSQTDSAVSSEPVILKDSMLVNDGVPDSLLTKKPAKRYRDITTVMFNVGFIVPMGNYASGDYTNPLAGYAKEGYSFGAMIHVHVHKSFNFVASYTWQMNKFDNKSFAVNALKGKDNYTVETISNWRSNFFLGGVSYDVELEDDNYLTPHFMIGSVLARSPSYEILPNKNNLKAVYTETVASEFNYRLAMRLGFGLKKNLSKQLYLSINPDFYYSSLKLNINKSFTNVQNAHQSISNVSLVIGLGVRFNK